MLFWKTRRFRSYKAQNEHSINAIFDKEGPDWMAWLYWFYPIFNFSFLTPAVVLTAETAVYSTYFLISLNFALSFWHVQKLMYNLFFDHGNRGLHFTRLLVLIGASAAAAILASATLPVALPDASLIVIVFFYANIVSTCINFTNTVCMLILPWMQSALVSLTAWLFGRPPEPLVMPPILKDKSKISNDYFQHNASIKDLFNKLKGKHLVEEQDDSAKKILHFRQKALNLCYSYRQRKLAKLGGPLTEADKIKKAQKLGRTIYKEGKILPDSKPFNFFFSRLNKHMTKLSFALDVNNKLELALNRSNDRDSVLNFLKLVNNHFEIDQLATAISKLEAQPDLLPEEALKQHVFLDDQTTELQSILNTCTALIRDRAGHYLVKIHDEEGLTKNELRNALENEYLAKLKLDDELLDKDTMHKMTSFAIQTLSDILQSRTDAHVTCCPLDSHDCYDNSAY